MTQSSSVDKNLEQHVASGETVGVQDLIDRLKSEGVQEGQQQAEALLGEAKKQAASIVEAAREEAERMIQDAQKQAERIQTNGKKALSLASRDASLHLKEQLEHQFRAWIGNLVRSHLDAPEFLTGLMTEMAKQVTAASDLVTQNNSEHQPSDQVTFLISETQNGDLESFVQNQVSEMLQQGIQLQASPQVTSGFRVQKDGGQTQIDFTDEAVTAALMRSLAPKFRAMLGTPAVDRSDT